MFILILKNLIARLNNKKILNFYLDSVPNSLPFFYSIRKSLFANPLLYEYLSFSLSTPPPFLLPPPLLPLQVSKQICKGIYCVGSLVTPLDMCERQAFHEKCRLSMKQRARRFFHEIVCRITFYETDAGQASMKQCAVLLYYEPECSYRAERLSMYQFIGQISYEIVCLIAFSGWFYH